MASSKLLSNITSETGGRKTHDRPDERTPLLEGWNNSRSRGPSSTLGGAVVRADEEAASCGTHLTDKPPRETVQQNVAGVFVANADGSLVLATSGTISSEFQDLESAGWIITSYTLAMCATQSLYGKLSDIYGRKALIMGSYVFFIIGCAICGLGQSMQQVVLGRLISGVGGAGINCLVSIVIADILPIREVASWRSYVNLAATTGRSLGGPIGGYLCETVGWRWSFLGQCPPTLIAMALVAWKLKMPAQEAEFKESQFSKVMRIDFLGALLLSTSIVCGLLGLDLCAQNIPWLDPRVLTMLAASLVMGICFLLAEAFWATEPIFPLRLLLNWDVVTSYVNIGFQSAAQMAMMAFVPLYFQISAHASTTVAGAHLMPSVIGNAIGGLIAGVVIRRTGRYKLMAIIGALSSTTAYFLMMVRWHGHTSFLESLYVVPGGFGNGIALSTTFIGLTAGVEPSQLAIASSGLYLSSNIGTVGGLSITTVVLQSTLTNRLRTSLEGIDDRDRFIRKALTDLTFVSSLRGRLGKIVTQVYIESLSYTHGVSFICGLIALTATFCIREHIFEKHS